MDENESGIGMSDGDESSDGREESGGEGPSVSENEENEHNHNNDRRRSHSSEDDEDDDDGDKSQVTANNVGDLLLTASSAAAATATAAAPEVEVQHVPPRRFMQVEGFDGRRNDIVYCKPAIPSPSPTSNSEEEGQVTEDEGRHKLILFFGGDIQDFPEMMEQHRDHRNYVQFNLEATAVLLQKQFPSHHVAVVRPSRIQMLTFSCYDNFVHCNHTGAPEHVITHHSLHHLELLLQNLSKRIAKAEEQDELDHPSSSSSSSSSPGKSKDVDGEGGSSQSDGKDEDSTVSSTTVDESTAQQRKRSREKSKSREASMSLVRLDRASISLVGFSKGCVVLNQLLYEFHYLKTLTPDDLSMDEFLTCIRDMYWLDGGHNGGKNTWITSRSLLETLTRLGVHIHVHLTPYQLLDDRRPWIRKEEKLFSELLKKFNAPIVRQIHFDDEPASLLQHLRIIGDFATGGTSRSPSSGGDSIVGAKLSGGLLHLEVNHDDNSMEQ